MTPKLWTPRQHIISPTCHRCGGLRRDWLREHRRQAGFITTRACCCETLPSFGCDGTTELSVTWTPGDSCGCFLDVPDGDEWHHYTTFTFAPAPSPLQHMSTGVEGDVCTFCAVNDDAPPYYVRDTYDNDSCSGPPLRTATRNHIITFVQIRIFDGEPRVWRVAIGSLPFGASCPSPLNSAIEQHGFSYHRDDDGDGSGSGRALGETIPQTEACGETGSPGTGNNVAVAGLDGGSVLVELEGI